MEEQPLTLGAGGPTISAPLGMGLWSWGDSMVRHAVARRTVTLSRLGAMARALCPAPLLNDQPGSPWSPDCRAHRASPCAVFGPFTAQVCLLAPTLPPLPLDLGVRQLRCRPDRADDAAGLPGGAPRGLQPLRYSRVVCVGLPAAAALPVEPRLCSCSLEAADAALRALQTAAGCLGAGALRRSTWRRACGRMQGAAAAAAAASSRLW